MKKKEFSSQAELSTLPINAEASRVATVTRSSQMSQVCHTTLTQTQCDDVTQTHSFNTSEPLSHIWNKTLPFPRREEEQSRRRRFIFTFHISLFFILFSISPLFIKSVESLHLSLNFVSSRRRIPRLGSCLLLSVT